jgi:pimeloyl-ACP methyl ester carboxylesterase
MPALEINSMRVILIKSFIFILCLAPFGCKEETVDPIVPEVYETSTLITSRTQDEIRAFAKSRNLPISADEIESGVDVYKVTYKTTFNGQSIIASGLVILPQTHKAVGMLSFQHGTIIAHSEAPSETPPTSELMTFYATIASPGFIGVIPDFIGFGASKDLLHPYYLEKPTADAVVDNLKAAREFALLSGLNFNGKLFLAGYSQGGYATMAAHKSIEENGLENFNLIASFPSSGGYDIKGVQEFFFDQQTYSQPFYIAFVAYSYKTYLGWQQPLTDFFQPTYAAKIPGLFNGQNSSSEINDQLTTEIPSLISPDLLQNIDTDPRYSYINEAFIDNSLTDWTPKVKMFMYHGDLDITVPYQNSVDVYNHFIQNGASSEVVSFTTLPYANHSGGVAPYLIAFINKLLTLK